MPWVRAVHQGRRPHSGFSFRLLRAHPTPESRMDERSRIFPAKNLAVRALYEAFHRVHPAMFGQIMVMRMFREKHILMQICGNNFMVLKAAPPLM
jgi:hypothetical protein